MMEPARSMPSPKPFLDVERSVRGRMWIETAGDPRIAASIAQRCGVSELVARVLAARGIDETEAGRFLEPQLRSFLPDPSVLRDMDRAASRLADAILAARPIGVFGDYDVDGATSTALLLRYLRAVGAEARFHIPDRIAEGYGPNLLALASLRSRGADVVVAVDCGTTAHAVLDEAAAQGIEVIVFDHHAAEAALPKTAALVNPNRLDEGDHGRAHLGQLAACGVTFLAIVALNRELRQRGWLEGKGEPDLLGLLDLVALGTVCDVVPLTGLNRALVAQGLRIMQQRRNPGLAALADVAGVKSRLDAYHLGYVLGPRVNAGGRIGRSDLGARLLSTDDPVEAAGIARLLDQHNDDRRAIEQEVLDACMAEAERQADGHIMVLAGIGWHPGVIGIVASRVKERFDRPVCVIAFDRKGDVGVGKASGRSVPGIDLGAAVIEARRAGHLMAGGGHAMAAGFTVAAPKLDQLRRFLSDHVARQRASIALAPVPTLGLDGAIDAGAVTVGLAGDVQRLAPFGPGNAEPRFALTQVRVESAAVVGEHHVRCRLVGASGARVQAIAFRAMADELGPSLLATSGAPLHVAGTLRLDDWGGNTRVQMQIEDAATIW